VLRLGARYSRGLRKQTGLSPYRAEVMKQGRTPSVECRPIEHVQPSPDVAERLGVSTKAKPVVRRENWYFADDQSVQVGVTFIPWTIAGDSVLARKADTGSGSIYARFEELGHPIVRMREEISARLPTPEESQRLAMPFDRQATVRREDIGGQAPGWVGGRPTTGPRQVLHRRVARWLRTIHRRTIRGTNPPSWRPQWK
jgi:DNA-binding GntR family transcriptional regulator